jgi:hypothetical protein
MENGTKFANGRGIDLVTFCAAVSVDHSDFPIRAGDARQF